MSQSAVPPTAPTDRGLPSAQVVLLWSRVQMLKELKGSALFQLFKSECLPHV